MASSTCKNSLRNLGKFPRENHPHLVTAITFIKWRSDWISSFVLAIFSCGSANKCYGRLPSKEGRKDKTEWRCTREPHARSFQRKFGSFYSRQQPSNFVPDRFIGNTSNAPFSIFGWLSWAEATPILDIILTWSIEDSARTHFLSFFKCSETFDGGSLWAIVLVL